MEPKEDLWTKLKSSLSLLCRARVYVTKPAWGESWRSLCAVSNQRKKIHCIDELSCQAAWVEIGFKEINPDCFKPAGKLEWGHDTGLILMIMLFGTSLNFHVNHSLETASGREKMVGLSGEDQGYY